jgi:hypothetical protein
MAGFGSHRNKKNGPTSAGGYPMRLRLLLISITLKANMAGEIFLHFLFLIRPQFDLAEDKIYTGNNLRRPIIQFMGKKNMKG